MDSGVPYKPVLEAHGTEVKTPAGGARWYRKPLNRLRWRDVRSILGESFEQWQKHNATRLGASLAFYALLSFAPLLLVLISIVGLVFGHWAAQRTVVEHVRNLIGPTAGNALAVFLRGSRNTTHGIVATVFGLATLLFSASGVVTELRDALNTIWDVPQRDLTGMRMVTGFIKRRLFSFAIVMSVGLVLIILLAISAWINALGTLIPRFPGFETTLLDLASSAVSFLVIACIFAAIYKIMPNVRIEWRDVILGSVATSVLFTIGKLVLGIYLGRASYRSTYGAAASIVVLIAWVYYSGQIFFLGAEFTRTFARRYGSHRAKKPEDMVQVASDVEIPHEHEVLAPQNEEPKNTRSAAHGAGST
jgi:membrane protein